jgi:hypothetical protein
MVLGLTTFALIHTLLSLVAIVAGIVVVKGLLGSRVPGGWTALYLVTAIATSATGFGFPFERFIDSHWTGAASLVVFALVILARYAFRLAGFWRWVYALGMVLGLWFLVVVLIAQAFKKVPALTAMAPTQTEPPFLVAQLVAFAVLGVLAIAAVRKFRPTRAML